MIVACAGCDALFEMKNSQQKYHSAQCANRFNARKSLLNPVNKTKSLTRAKEYYWKNREDRLTRTKLHNQKLKQIVFNHYGNKCYCDKCPEVNFEFLTVDHVNNDGSEHRKIIGQAGTATYRWIIKNNFPTSVRLMCYNCNLGRAKNGGICPHQKL